jgi:uncharacterized membrane protein
MFDLAFYHPLVVHAPLVLLPIAIGFAIADLLVPRARLRLAAMLLLLLGAGGAFLATQTGEAAEHAAGRDVGEITVSGTIPQTVGGGSLLETHQTLGDLTAYLYGALFVVEAAVWFTTAETTRARRGRWTLAAPTARLVRGIWLTVGTLGLVLVVLTGYYGGQLVYDHGVGVTQTK